MKSPCVMDETKRIILCSSFTSATTVRHRPAFYDLWACWDPLRTATSGEQAAEACRDFFPETRFGADQF